VTVMDNKPVSFAFGNTPQMADSRLALVIAGKKTATSSPFDADDPDRPFVGQRAIILDGAGRPGALIETMRLTQVRFGDVDTDHAIAEGYETLADWRAVRESIYRQEGIFSPDMMLVGQYFRLVEVLPREGLARHSAISFAFGDSPAMANELLALVVAGVKTATCGALRDFPEGSPDKPVVGRRDVVLDGQGRPAAIIETLEVTIRRFDEMDEQFAFDEGEGFRTLDYWREGHQAYFERNGGFSPDMLLVCERFRLVEVLDRV
jgi:uncharacterized protein YhfF